MSAIDKIISHYDAQGLLKLNVPEWDDESGPFELYYTPMTVRDRNKIVPDLKNNNLDFVVSVIVLKALDENGGKLFEIQDKHKLKTKADFKLLDRIASQIMDGGGESLGEQ